MGAGTQVTVATTTPSQLAGTLAFTSFQLAIGTPTSTVTFSPSAGWTPLANSGATARSEHFVASYMLDAPTGTAMETMTASSTGNWIGCITTFRP